MKHTCPGQLPALMLLMLSLAWFSHAEGAENPSKSTNSTGLQHASNTDQCQVSEVHDICSLAQKCCLFGVDEYGWIAAAVGWSLWFLTLILLCVDKITKLDSEDTPKYTRA
ncbi:transmembrane protein 213 [Latimeria chalumnae]|uniref:transmembrane protein 213 n=1 Tax=Latimeria chalumnae TaxID=7897 RepID=UPI0003C1AD4C|nr:PREDICTED: transmembrane protein 213 [Latimeria chalumnae]|eukprot:XP_005989497.1 PREDICTED: transmembrane protein 213 [Latimeria chalumnae]